VHDHLDPGIVDRPRALRGLVGGRVVDDVHAVDETGEPLKRRDDQLRLVVRRNDHGDALRLEHCD